MVVKKIRKLYFATSNKNKLREAKRILGIPIKQLKIDIVEPQLWDIEDIAVEKAKFAYAKAHKPLMIEDTGLYIKALKGFPASFNYWVQKSIGNAGLLKLMKGVKNRRAEAKAVVCFYDGKRLKNFVGSVKGKIAHSEKGGGWGFDPIFISQGYSRTYGELGEEKKNEISHRARAFKKFKTWLQK